LLEVAPLLVAMPGPSILVLVPSVSSHLIHKTNDSFTGGKIAVIFTRRVHCSQRLPQQSKKKKKMARQNPAGSRWNLAAGQMAEPQCPGFMVGY
jgi:hypothetical protein